MFRYYQTSEKSKWKLISNTDKVIEEVKSSGGIKATVLSLSEDITEDTDLATVKYRGPFYADIDCKEDIQQAAKSTLTLLDNLVNKEVPEDQIRVYASGSKGFHIIINEKNFSSGRAVKSLPKIYKEMALAIYVPGMDMQVYSMGRGNSWRIENIKRYDGNYRVRITRKELKSVVKKGREAYNALVAQPKKVTVLDLPPEKKSHSLEALFVQARVAAGKEPKIIEPVEDDKLKAAFKDELPQCMVDIREGKLRKGTNFNQACLTVATFASRVGMPTEERESYNSRMSEMTHSSTYNNPRDRYDHLMGLMAYTDTKNGYQHSCVATKSKISTKPCEDCALYKEGDDDNASMEDLGIAIINSSYFRMGKNENTRITTFYIANVLKVKGVLDENPGVLITKGVQCDVITTSGEVHRRIINESVWKSKSSFLTILEGIEGAVFLGTDLDVQRIKYMVFDDEEEMEEVREVDAAGIHIDYVDKMPVPVYVEPSFSVNKYGVVNSHTLNREVPNPPHMTSISVEEDMIAAAAEAFSSLIKINEPKVIVPLLGWFGACHIKSHIFESFRQFPLVNVWGNAGAGKTRTAEIFMWLSGAGSKHNSLSLSLPHTTKFPLINYTTSTTTIPRVLEEFNKARISKLNYDYYHELMKSAFNHHHVSRGALGGSANGKINAKSVELKITSPILYISEQPVESPPLKQRSISISMNSKGREAGRDAFFTLEPMQHHLETIAKMMALTATRTSVSEVKDMVDAVDMSKYRGMEERPKFALQVIVAGLGFVVGVLEKYNVEIDGLDELIKSYTDSIDDIVEEVADQTTVTEVDQVIEDLALMAYLKGKTNIDGLEEGVHYFLSDDAIIIDMQVAHALYKRYKRSEGGTLVIDNYSQMSKLIKTEPYFISDQTIPDEITGNRKMTELSLEAMRKKGIEISLFGV